MNEYLVFVIWLAGFLLSFWMLKVEHEAEKKELTNGDEVMAIILSLFSYAAVLFILVKTWAASVSSYWTKPVKKNKAE